MTPSDLITHWIEHMNFLVTLLLAFLSSTSAFLIVANVKGRDLPKQLCTLILFLYCFASVFFLGFMSKVAEGIFNLRNQMHEAGMSWYVVVYEPQGILPSLFIVGALIMISLMIGSVWYLLSLRRSAKIRPALSQASKEKNTSISLFSDSTLGSSRGKYPAAWQAGTSVRRIP